MAAPLAPRSASSRPSPAPAPLVVQYVGFQDAPGRRDYVLLAQLGEKVREYTVYIDRASFEKRRALLQDGPDICYQKLLRELVDTDLAGPGRLRVSDEDLTRDHAAHAPPARRPNPRRIFVDAADESEASGEHAEVAARRVV